LTATRNGGIKQSIYVEEPADCIGAAHYSSMLFCDQDNSLCVNLYRRVAGDSRRSVPDNRSSRQPWFQPAAFFHLRDRQSLSPLTAPRLGQVLEWARFSFEPMESRENRGPHRWCETAVHLRAILERAPLVIADQDRIEVPTGRGVATDREVASLEDAHFLPHCRPLARFVQAIAPLGDDALEALLPDRFN
jgi:hypothetical protein